MNRVQLRQSLDTSLRVFENANRRLPGVQLAQRRRTFIEQVIDSMRRIEFIEVIRDRDKSPLRVVPELGIFDPLRAAVIFNQEGQLDEACWLTFLATHCGKHKSHGWNLVRAIYAGDGVGARWSWLAITQNIGGFRRWLHARNWHTNGAPGRFGNHRKYESLDGLSQNGTGAVVESYTSWVGGAGGHRGLIENALLRSQDDPMNAFDHLYRTMESVRRFGRLARFDFLCMLGKLRLARIEPATPYLKRATGPRKGAELLAGTTNLKNLEAEMAALGRTLGVHMQVIEDALCNWQKSPDEYQQFNG